MSKVFAVCEPFKLVGGIPSKAVDLSPAIEYGELEVLLPHTQSLTVTVPTVQALNKKLEGFSDNDYILPIGDPILMSTVAMIASTKNGGRVKFLKWDKKLSRYYPIQVDISGKAV